jgi:glucan endo-1,3-beta-D-glucosidase
LQGNWQFPHLIVPVNSQAPTVAYGISYNGTISTAISTVFNFDIPTSYAGLTCSLIFLFPEQSQLKFSSYTFSGQGGLAITQLSSPASESTTYDTLPSGTAVGGVSLIGPGNSYVFTNQPCAAGESVGYKVSATGDVYLDYFQDYGQPPIGFYVVAC